MFKTGREKGKRKRKKEEKEMNGEGIGRKEGDMRDTGEQRRRKKEGRGGIVESQVQDQGAVASDTIQTTEDKAHWTVPYLREREREREIRSSRQPECNIHSNVQFT